MKNSLYYFDLLDGTKKRVRNVRVQDGDGGVVLYDRGYDNTAITGGWDGDFVMTNNYQMSKLQLDSDNMYRHLIGNGSLQASYRSPMNLINVTNYNKISVLWDYELTAGENNCVVFLAVYPYRIGNSGGFLAIKRIDGSMSANGTDVESYIDVSNITGLVCLVVAVQISYFLSDNYFSKGAIKKIWIDEDVKLERKRNLKYKSINGDWGGATI